MFNDWKILLLACLTIGLAPFFPEPHVWAKLRWVAGGAKGMEVMDWIDLTLHGLPWILLIRYLLLRLLKARPR